MHKFSVEFNNPPNDAYASYHTHWAESGQFWTDHNGSWSKLTPTEAGYSQTLGRNVYETTQYHSPSDLTIQGNTYVVNPIDGSFHAYGSGATSTPITSNPFVRYFIFP